MPSKGATEFGVKWLARQIQSTGVRSFINHSDAESSLQVLKDAAAQMVPDVESKPREYPVGDRQANGSIEVGVRELRRQSQVNRYQLELNLGLELDNKDPVLPWIPQFSGHVLRKGRKHRKDGKTSFEKETGKIWLKLMYEFCEKLLIKGAS